MRCFVFFLYGKQHRFKNRAGVRFNAEGRFGGMFLGCELFSACFPFALALASAFMGVSRHVSGIPASVHLPSHPYAGEQLHQQPPGEQFFPLFQFTMPYFNSYHKPVTPFTTQATFKKLTYRKAVTIFYNTRRIRKVTACTAKLWGLPTRVLVRSYTHSV